MDHAAAFAACRAGYANKVPPAEITDRPPSTRRTEPQVLEIGPTIGPAAAGKQEVVKPRMNADER